MCLKRKQMHPDVKEPYLDCPVIVGHLISILVQSASTEGKRTGSEAHRNTPF